MTAIYFDARINGEQLQKDIAQINKYLATITNTVKKEGNEIDGLARRMGESLAGAFTVFAAGNFVKDIARVRGEFQQLEVAFETMLGSKANADRLMSQVVDFAARTPFQLQDVATGAKQLLAYGTAADDIIPTLKSLGDVSAGLSVPIERLILNYGQVRTQLKMTGRELRDFNVAGVPIVAELSKNLGVAESKIADMVEKGQIGFNDVEQAFQTMTSQGGRFNDLMDKQAKTITGLASNFSDAWNKMMNSIGQQNEGIIAGSITGAMEVVENYEQVLDILKILVATYGTYKAAVIATGIATATARTYGIYDIATKQLQTGATLKAAAAQTALNTAMKINPYILIASVVAGLATSLIVFGNSVKKTEEYISDLDEAITGLGKQADTDSLIEKYNTLANKANKTEQEQNDLNRTISQLSLIFPDAIEYTNQYGQAIELAYDELVKMNDELRKNAGEVANKELVDTQSEINNLLQTQKRLQSELNAGGRTYDVTDPTTGIRTKAFDKFDKKDRENAQKELATVSSDLDKLATKAAELQGKIATVGQIDVERFKNSYKELFGAVAGISKSQLEETKNSLEKLLVYPDTNPEIIAAIRKQVDAINTEMNLPLVETRIAQAKADLDAAEARVKALQSGKSTINETELDKQNEIIKNSTEFLNKWGVETGKNAKKTLDEQKKAKQEQLQAEQDYADARLNLERQVQASIIATQKEGAERQKKEAELEYQLQLDEIKRLKEGYIEAYNASLGIKKGEPQYKQTLDQADLDKIATLELNAKIQRNEKIEEIDKQSAKRIKSINDEISQAFLDNTQREIKAIEDKYTAIIEAAAKEGKDVSVEANAAKEKEITAVIINEKLRQLEFDEEIAIQQAEIATQGWNKEIELEKKKLVIVRDIAQKKLDLLKATDAKLYANEIKLLEGYIEATDKGLKNGFQIGDGSEKAKQYKDELELILQITDALMEQFGMNKANAKIINDLLSGGLQLLLSGNPIQLIGAAVQTIISLFPQTAAEKYANQIERINLALETQKRLIEQSKRSGGEVEARLAEIELLKQKTIADEAALVEAQKKKDNALGWGDAYEEKKQKVKDLTKVVEEDKAAIEAAEQALNDFLSGGVTQNTIADVIAEGFQAGKTSVDDFAEYMNDVLLDAVMQIFKAEILGPEIDALAQYIKDALSDKKLTEEEKTNIDSLTKLIAEQNKPLWDNLTSALNLGKNNKENQQGLTGEIKGITEETGSLIAGQFFAFREIQQKTYLTGIEQLDGINKSVTHLAEIAANTRHNARLNEIAETALETNRILKERL